MQDTNLFADTVLENIRYGRLDATDDECIMAAKLAGEDSFISNRLRLPLRSNPCRSGPLYTRAFELK